MDGLIWFIMEHPNLKWMILGYPYFGKPPCISTTNEAHHCQPPSAVFAHRVAQKACERRLLWAAVQSMSLLWQMIKFRELQAVIIQECLGVRAPLNKWVIPSVIINGISPLISADPGLRQRQGRRLGPPQVWNLFRFRAFKRLKPSAAASTRHSGHSICYISNNFHSVSLSV